MNTRPKPKKICWLQFLAQITILFAFLLLLAFVFDAISKPALAYDSKLKNNQANLK